MTDKARTTLLRYGVALAALALATAARFALDPALGDHLPYVTYFVAIMAVARYGGLGPSLATLALGSLAATYFFVPPRGGLVPHRLPDAVGIGLYFLVGLPSVLLCEALRDARRRTEALASEAAEKEERLRVTLASIGDAVIATDPQGRVAFMNPVAEALIGWRAGEAVGRPLEEVFRIVNAETRRPAESPVVRALREATVVGLANHTLLIARDGAEWPIADSAAPIRDAGGHLVGVVIVFRDETERRRMEVALEESEDHYRHAVELSPQLPWTADPDGRMTDFSDRWLALTGLSREQALGHGWLRLPHPEDLPRMREAWGRSVRTGEPYDIEHRTRLADGDYRWMRSRAFPRRGEDGAVVRWYGTTEDIDDRKVAEEEARRQARITGAITENATTAIFLMDAEGRTTFMNPAAEAMTGYALREVEGRVLHDVIHHHRPDGTPLPMDECPIGRHVLAQRDLRGHEDTFIRKDGTFFPVRCAARPIVEGGSLTGIVLEAQDITEERRAGQRVRFQAHLLDSVGQAVIATDPQGRVIYWNRSAEATYGWLAAEAEGRSILYLVVAPESAGRAAEIMARMLAGEGWSGEFTVRRRDGTTFPASVNDTPVFDDRGALEAVIGVSSDITERKQAEERLRDSEERFRGLMEQAPFSVQVFSPDGRITQVNRAWEELWGVTPEMIPEYNVLTDPQVEAKGILHHIRRAFAGESVAVPAIEYDPNETLPDRTRHDDPRRWVSAVAYPLKDAAGRVREVVLVHQDITERMRAEEALRGSEARFRQLADTMPQIVWVTRPDGYHEYYNRRWYDYIGCTPEDCLGHGWNAPLHPDDRQRSIDRWEFALRTGEPYEIEYRFRSKEGDYRWFLARAMPVRDDAGRVVRWFGTCTDIEDIKRSEGLLRRSEARYRDAERALRTSQERLMAALSASDTGTFRWEPETGVFLDFDDSLKGLFGFAPDHPVRATEDFIGRVHPDDRTGFGAALDRSRRGEDFEMEYRVALPDGGIRWLYDRGKMVRDGGGRPAYLVGACTDITKRKRVEEALQDADRRKDEFLATLAHELRNPLAPIRNALRLMRGPGAGCEGMEAERAMAERQVVHLARLIDDLMDVARISKGKLELHREVVDLHTVVRQAVETARTQIDDRRHRLSVSLPDEVIRLEADPTRLEQVFWNLLNNAAKYTEPGGSIDLAAEVEEGQVVVRVRDTGIGIAPEMLPRLFQMFVQVGEHRHHAQGGLGIGLGLVRTLVELHGGTITAHSDGPGTGSEFVVRLPTISDALEPRGSETGRRAGSDDRPPRRRILVVDDNVDAASSLAKLLSRLYGQEVRVAHDGPEALEVAEQFRPEVVLLDIGLPGMDGNEVARRMRGRPETERALIVALTGWGQESDRQKSAQAGFDRHLVKPVDPEVVRALLDDHRPVPGAADLPEN